MPLKRKDLIANAFNRYARRMLLKEFDGVAMLPQSVATLNELASSEHAIIYSTHSSWWDVIVGCYLSLHTGLRLYAPMDPAQLKKYFVLNYVGLFPASTEQPLAFLRTATEIFTAPRSGLWITPQGRFYPNRLPSPLFMRGLTLVIERQPTMPVYALTMDYEFWNETRPIVTMALSRVNAQSEQDLRETLDTQTKLVLDTAARRDASDWEWLLRSKPQTVKAQDMTNTLRNLVSNEQISTGHTR